ncbi:hypothetical protein L218DRAFT_956537 [Marasmius fiardii PR-910]|nr:hypothetical protein L218DRAFT_956537 [Marasmius fiardii PR-910]
MDGHLMVTPASLDISGITGNASDKAKAHIADIVSFFGVRQPDLDHTFADSISPRIRVTEVSFSNSAEEPSKKEGRVVCRIKVESDMVNGRKHLHGGCSAFLIDICSTLSLSAYSMETTGRRDMTVSQAINTVYHSPAILGDELKIVNASVSVGKRALTARTEIWNETHHRLVASGTHIKMLPSSLPSLSNSKL